MALFGGQAIAQIPLRAVTAEVRQTNSSLANRLVLQGASAGLQSFAAPLPGTNLTVNSTPLVVAAQAPAGGSAFSGIHGRGAMQLNAVLSSGPLLNVNFNATTGDKVGFAVTGLSSDDIWNGYSFYGQSDVTLTDLSWSDGTSSGVDMQVVGAPSTWGLATGDGMFDSYIASYGSSFTVTFSNLPPGIYDIYLYGHGAADVQGGVFGLVSGSTDYGGQSLTTVGSASWTTTNWLDGVQYALFGGVAVAANDPVTVTVYPASDGFAVLNGVQITPHTAGPIASLVNVDFGEPGGSTNGMGAVGLSGSDVWNLSNSKFNEGLATTGPLVWSDGLASPLMLGIQNAPGLWYNPTGNAVYDTYVYPWDAGNITFALTNLANGYYDFYLYGHGAADNQNSIFGLATGGVDYGLKATTTVGSDSWTSLVWTEGMQYVVFRGIPVTTNDPVTITVYPDSSAYGPVALLNSLQVVLPVPSVDTDSDADGLPDNWELQHGLNPHDPSDAATADTDGDGLPDVWELRHFGNLNQTASGDYDGDGLSNLWKYRLHLDPTNPDTNGNGVSDGDEDSDGDGLTNAEELAILVDVDHPEWGYLDPRVRSSANTQTLDGAKDSDHDGISNLGEVRTYLTDPMSPHTFTASRTDSEYLFTSGLGESASLSLAVLRMNALPQNVLQFTISDAFPSAEFDLYFLKDLNWQRWQWRRVYSGVKCDDFGNAVFLLKQPEPQAGFFVILSAEDQDEDGLSDGYETWFKYPSQQTMVNVRDSDFDSLSDNWEVEYGLNPTTVAGSDGAIADPDGDLLSNYDEYRSYNVNYPAYDPLESLANRPVIWISADESRKACGEASFIITRSVADSGDLASPLQVYYSLGGDLVEGVDYTLSPTPADLPRIYSATIPAGESSVTVTATLIGNAVPSGTRRLVASITPYSVAVDPQVSNPASWAYVVDWNYNRATATFFFDNLRPYAYSQSGLLACPDTGLPITLQAYDACNDPLTFFVVSAPSHGQLSGTPPNVTYTPNAGYAGEDTFTFKANDGFRDSDLGTISITVGDSIVAYDQYLTTCRNTDLPITLQGSSPCGGGLTFNLLTPPTHGTLSGTVPDLTYHPGVDFEGYDSFTFKVNDGLQDSYPATVSIEVGSVPQAISQYLLTDVNRSLNIMLTGSDSCGDNLTFSIVDNPTSGILGGTVPAVTYMATAAGDDSFTFKVNDGLQDSPPAPVRITVLPAPILTAAGACDGIGLEWAIPPDVIDGYGQDIAVLRADSPGGPYSLIATLVENQDSHPNSYLDTSVIPGVTYYYKVGFDYLDTHTSTAYRVESSMVEASTRAVPFSGPMDVAFIIDNTGSIGTELLSNLKNEMGTILDCLEAASGVDYQLALVTPDEDQVDVRLSFSPNNRNDFLLKLDEINNSIGGRTPESTDQCLNTILEHLTAAGRSDPDGCYNRSPLQIGNFTAFRENARKLVVLITDAPPGGFCDNGSSTAARAHEYALKAKANCVKINAVMVQLSDGSLLPDADMVMMDYYHTTCGWYSLAPHGGGDVSRAILKMIYEASYCECTP